MILTRRRLLVGLAIVGAASASACTQPNDEKARRSDSEDPQLNDLIEEQELLHTYEAVINRYPQLRDRLTPLREAHKKHVQALREMLAESGTASTDQGQTSDSASSTSSSKQPVADDPTQALAELRRAERAAAQSRRQSCLVAPADRAPLLGSIAACEASHEVVLA